MRNLTRHWLRVKLRVKQGEVGRGGTPAREISFVSFRAYGPNSALTMGVTASETRQGSSQQVIVLVPVLKMWSRKHIQKETIAVIKL